MQVLLLLVLSLAVLSRGQEETIIKMWKVVGPFWEGPREVMIDHLVPYGGEQSIVPSDTQRFYSVHSDSGIVRWFSVNTETSLVTVKYPRTNWDFLEKIYGGVGVLATGYASAVFTSMEDRIALVFIRKAGTFTINGVKYVGEQYSSDYTLMPVRLKKGENRILVRFSAYGDTQFEFRILNPKSSVVVLRDLTVPDIILGQTGSTIAVGVPLVNTTERWISGAEVRIRADSVFDETVTPVGFPIAPLSIVKVPVWCRQRHSVSGGKEHCATLEVVGGGKSLGESGVAFRIRAREQNHTRTFLSAIDSSVQYYGVVYPKAYDPAKTYALILSLHGAGVEGSRQAEVYAPKEWAFVVTPTNRRPYGFDWQDWGRLDLNEVKAEAVKRFRIDERRIYLVGHSMGGQGVWHNGLHNPSAYAALAPSAGWTSFQVYTPFFLQRSALFASPQMLSIRDRVLMECNNPLFVVNAKHLRIIATEGALDDNVPPVHPRMYQSIMQNLGYEMRYREVPGKNHWWDDPAREGSGSDCVDNQEIMDFLREQTLDPYPREVVFRLVDLSAADRFYWVRVMLQKTPCAFTEGRVRLSGDTLAITTVNVEKLECALPPDVHAGTKLEILWNDRGFRVTVPASRRLELSLEKRLEKPGPLRKSAGTYGPLKSVLFAPCVLVCGTSCTLEEQELLLANARFLAAQYWQRGNGRVRIARDVDVTDRDMQEKNLVLFGSPARNSVTARLLNDAPLRVDGNSVVLEGRRMEGPDQSLVMVYPNLLHPERLVAVFSGTTLRGERNSILFHPLFSASGVPDFVLFDADVKMLGWGGVRAAGFFSNNWDLGNKDYSVKE